ncbi:PRC-barrel domain containing protein [Halalkalicoccus sp. NIPERK01]|uniref:PRC-barrel domain containing protein n=1 Tax=Halalkalicoccus sp. NIPERK01 TaxID=3053469 RepID=UPI00256F0F7E|nr:PRC-barrel domain containing protein [Halalkalicoccus sp. NIPERK01]MDL5363780.1 PRC-barrel domain containing protein [Halalkalicoccus sp. NIPERK01]
MSIEITDSEIGTPVLDATGLEIGIVSLVENGTAMLDPNPTIADEIRSVFGLARPKSDHIPLTGDLVDSTDDGVIRLSVPNRSL